MIQELTIRNFKSIRDLKIPCKKLNVFIGEPNSGKSNIIEAFALQSQNAIGEYLNKDIFRYKTISDLFYDFSINEPIEIITSDKKTILKYSIRENGVSNNIFNLYPDDKKAGDNRIDISHEGKALLNNYMGDTNVHFYEYKRLSNFSYAYSPHLNVPYGDNLPQLLLSNNEYKKWVSDFLKSKGITLTFKTIENEILISKLVEDVIFSFPYFSLSETLQRIIFYTIVLKSNKNSILLLDEPESNTFPFYTKELAERIALDKKNQFFITTHNPYLLMSLIEKSKKEDVNICITQMKDYQTKITPLKENQISKVLDMESDVFFNFEKILGK